jgi:hypothetical protein
VPYTLFAADQVPGSGVAATVYCADQSTPWLVNAATTVAPTLATEIALTPPGGTPVQGALHTVDSGSVDAALPFDYDPLTWIGPSYHWGNFEGPAGSGTAVQLDITAPVVTAMDPKNGNWQQGPAVVNSSGADVGGDGEITITYHGVDKVGIKSVDQTITVTVARTAPTVQGFKATVKKGQKAKFYYKVNLKKGKYYSRISAVDLAGNAQSQRGSGTLTVR